MRVVVTGAAGFIGSTLVDHLLGNGHDVVGIDCFTPYYDRRAKEANLADASACARFAFHEADLRTAALEPLFAGADAVVNEAAAPGLVWSWERFQEYESCNVAALQRVAEACMAADVGHLVHASTSSVYGEHALGDEDAPTDPVSPYGATKLAGEEILNAYGRTFGLPFTVLRYFSVYGPRQRPDMAYRVFCERMLRGEPLDVYGDGFQSRSNTYVDDAVAATVAALEAEASGETYNVGGGGEVTVLEAIDVLADALGTTPRIVHHEARRGDQRRTAANIERIGRDLGWKPTVLPADGLPREAAWVQRCASGR